MADALGIGDSQPEFAGALHWPPSRKLRGKTKTPRGSPSALTPNSNISNSLRSAKLPERDTNSRQSGKLASPLLAGLPLIGRNLQLTGKSLFSRIYLLPLRLSSRLGVPVYQSVQGSHFEDSVPRNRYKLTPDVLNCH